MEQITISGRIGKGSIPHNNRVFKTSNVNSELSPFNVTFVNEHLPSVYSELFSNALDEYNAKKTKTRDKIPDYYRHIENSKQEKLFHEVIFQFGDINNFANNTQGGNIATNMLQDFMQTFQTRNPHLRVFNAVLHVDEATPHLHIDFIPYTTNQKRGLSTRVSLRRALEQQGFTSIDRKHTEWQQWVDSEKNIMAGIAHQYGFTVEKKGISRPYLTIPEYKDTIALIQQANQHLNEINGQILTIKEVNNIEFGKTLFSKTTTVKGSVNGQKITPAYIRSLQVTAQRVVDIDAREVKLLTLEKELIEQKQNLQDDLNNINANAKSQLDKIQCSIAKSEIDLENITTKILSVNDTLLEKEEALSKVNQNIELKQEELTKLQENLKSTNKYAYFAVDKYQMDKIHNYLTKKYIPFSYQVDKKNSDRYLVRTAIQDKHIIEDILKPLTVEDILKRQQEIQPNINKLKANHNREISR